MRGHKGMLLLWTMFVLLGPSSTFPQGYVLREGGIVVETKAQWEEWTFPKGVVEITEDGRIRPIRIRKDVNAALDAHRFSWKVGAHEARRHAHTVQIDDRGREFEVRGGVRNAGSNVEDAGYILDGDSSTGWTPSPQDSLNRWWVEVDLGRLVAATRIVVKFAEQREGDPFLGFKVWTSTGEHLPGTDRLDWRLAGRTRHPNREGRRTFAFDLSPPLGEEGIGDQVRYVRLIVTDTLGDKAERVTRGVYEKLDPELQGAVEYFWKGPSGDLLIIGEKGYYALDPALRGPVKYYRRERPTLTELEVWALGDNILLGLVERGGSIADSWLVDGDFETSAPVPTEWYEVAGDPLSPSRLYLREAEPMQIDLGATFWMDAVRLLTHITHRERRGYRIRASDGSRAPEGGLQWETLTPEHRFVVGPGLSETAGTKAAWIEEAFPLRKVRFLDVLFRRTGGRSLFSRVREIQAYGEGYLPEVTLTSPLIYVRSGKGLNRIRWDADTPPGTRVEVRTRTGSELRDEVHYFDRSGNEITEYEYNRIPGFARPSPVVRQVPGSDWSSWSRAYRRSGARVASPFPRRYLMIQVRLLSDDPDRCATLRSPLMVETFNLLAHRIVGEIAPNEIEHPGHPEMFSIALRATFVPSDPGFDRILIRSRLVRDLKMVDVGESTAESRLDYRVASTGSDSLWIHLSEPIGPGGPDRLTIRFRATVFLHSTPFEVYVGREGVWQQVDPGDASDALESGTLTVAVPFRQYPIVNDVKIAPDPFTPNGDGINDDTVIGFTVLEIYGEKIVDIEIYSLTGKLVRRLSRSHGQAGGRYEIPWAGRDDEGRPVPPGIYLIRIRMDTDEPTARGTVACRTVTVCY